MIVKIQRSLFDSLHRTRVLIYNQSRSIEYIADDKDEVDALLKLMGRRLKVYAQARFNRKSKQLELQGLVNDQEW